MHNDNIFLFSTNANLVKGAKRGLLIDAHRNMHYIIPNSFIDFILKANKKSKKVIYEIFRGQENIITEYINFLDKNELVIWLASKHELIFFPKKSFEWDYPSTITNAIINLPQHPSNEYLIKLIHSLESVQCYNLVLKFEQIENADELINSIELFKNSMISFIEISIECNDKNIIENCIQYAESNARVAQINFFNCTIFTNGFFYDSTNHRLAMFSAKKIDDKNCGVVKAAYFNNMDNFYTESQHHNTCLNRKLSINSIGEIRNCPNMKEHFGNINTIELKEAIELEGFKKFWNIKKDDISICKNCEFRHVCTDCRAFIENPDDIYSKPLKCGYNPHTAEWEEWSTHPMKQYAIDYYGL